MMYTPVAPEAMAAPATTAYLRAVAFDVPELGHAHAEAIVSHGYEIAALAYAGRHSDVWTYGARLGWSGETTRKVARSALKTLVPYAVQVLLARSSDDAHTEGDRL